MSHWLHGQLLARVVVVVLHRNQRIIPFRIPVTVDVDLMVSEREIEMENSSLRMCSELIAD